ncbi:hypothetical protein EV140_1932 [Microcella alkaliphila]|uniref:Terminase n=1 Tax=Microcella alkaliphila TaxID=279828 RepID=A0A4Q7TH69_9MICO|nr:hypothetical protein [Microcella alkaliphila]RZT59327.1 hypothetical protein EV140_1932 [Microcella alkaliphila]
MPTNSPKPEQLELRGRQEPRLYTLPPRAGTLADDALDLWTVAGRELDPWQELSLDGIFSVDHAGFWTCTEWGELVARQNGKGDIITAYCLAKLFLWPKPDGTPRTIVYTAHQFKTAREMFRRMRFIIESAPLLMAELRGGARGITTAHGEEGFELSNGNRLLYLARSRNSGVGFTVDDLVVDEAQEASVSAMDALLPTMSSVENTQVLFFGTVPDELNEAEYWEGVRDRGRAATSPRTGWIEFNPDGSDDPDTADKIDIYDDDVAAAGNPGLGYRPGLTLEQITDERGEPGIEGRMSKESFRRQRLSIWPNRRAEVKSKLSELDLDVWDRHKSEDAGVAAEGMVLSLALGRGGGYGTIGKAIRVDESIAVEHHRTDRGTRWIADELKELKEAYGNPLLVLDPKNAAAVISSLDRAGVKYLAMNLDEIAAAHALFVEHVNAGLVPHRPQDEVRKSLEFATTRNIGRAGVTWEQSDPTKPVSMAQAVTWALWGVLKSEASPKKPPPPPPPPAEVIARDDVAQSETNLASASF